MGYRNVYSSDTSNITACTSPYIWIHRTSNNDYYYTLSKSNKKEKEFIEEDEFSV